MPPILIRLEDESCFTEATAVVYPLGQPVARTRTALHQSAQDKNAMMGVWECSPGKFRRQVMEAEYSYIISGEGRFIPDSGEAIEFQAGDALYLPANTAGTWDVSQALRKTYLIFD